MQSTVVAISLKPVLCLVQWDGMNIYLTTSTNFYSSVLTLLKWMAARRTFWSHCFTERQKITEQLTGSSLCRCPQHTLCRSSACSWNVGAAAFMGRACWGYVAQHVRLWLIESELISFFLSPPHSQLKHWRKCLWLFLSLLTQQSRTLLYSNLSHWHQEQMLCCLLNTGRL